MPRDRLSDGIFSTGKRYTYLAAEELTRLRLWNLKPISLLSLAFAIREITVFFAWRDLANKNGTHLHKAAGIGILVVVLALLLIIGCWYYKRRSGYKILQNKSSGADTMRTLAGKDAPLDCKAHLQEYSNLNLVVPDAPPAYDTISAEQSPPPYSPERSVILKI